MPRASFGSTSALQCIRNISCFSQTNEPLRFIKFLSHFPKLTTSSFDNYSNCCKNRSRNLLIHTISCSFSMQYSWDLQVRSQRYRSWSITMVEHSMQHETMHGDHCTGLVKISLDNTIRSPTVVQSNFNCQLKSLPINTQDCQEFLLGHPQRNYCYAFWTRANHQELKPQIFLILYLSLLRIKTNNLVFTRYSSPNSYLFQNPVWMQQELIMRQ